MGTRAESPAHGRVALSDVLSKSLPRLSPTHRRVAHFVANNPQFASLASTRQLAEKTGVDAATISRFAKAVGFAGFNHLRQELRHTYLGRLEPLELIKRQQTSAGNAYRAAVLRDVQNLQALLDTLDAGTLDRLASRMLSARQVLVVAFGSYAAPAVALAHLCAALEVDARAEFRGRVHWATQLAGLTSRDLVIGIGFWQCDRDVIAAVRWASEHGIPTAAITDSSVSPLARCAKLRVVVPSEGMLFFQSVTASLTVVYGLIAAMWARLPAGRRARYWRIRRAFRDLDVFAR
jgi:DNA-binding MurR/RpiR family transcriptional regulator